MTAPPTNLETALENAVARQLAPVHTAYRVVIAVVVVVACLLGYHFWKQGVADAATWRMRAVWALQDGQRQTAATRKWAQIADAFRDSAVRQGRITDSVRQVTPRYVVRYLPRTTTIPPSVKIDSGPRIVPVASSLAGAPLVPLPDSLLGAPMVLASAFDSLYGSCTRERHDCAAQLAARDSINAHQDSALRDLNRRVAAVTQERNQAERRSVLERIGYGVAGAAVGRLSCVVR